MLNGRVSAATRVIPAEMAGRGDIGKLREALLSSSLAMLPVEWQVRDQDQLSRWENIFSQSDFDVGCAKSAQHQIQLQEDKLFPKRARRVLLSDLEDLREQLAELRKSGVIRESLCFP